MAFFFPDPRSGMRLQQPVKQWPLAALRWRGRADVDPAEMFKAHVAVLVGADNPDRGAVVAVERLAVESVSDEYVVGQCVSEFDRF